MRFQLFRIFIFLTCITNQISAQDSNQLVIQKCSDFEVNGLGDHTNWSGPNWIQLVKRSGESDYITQVKMLYSETGIYFLFNNQDTLITSTMKSDFDHLYEEDVVEVFLWTDENIPIYFEYELSPYNYELPILVPNNNGDFMGWRPWHYEGDRKTQHAVKIYHENDELAGWRAEFFIPYALLEPLGNVPPSSGTRWRVNMYRIDYDNGFTGWTWQPVRTSFHEYERFGTFVFE